MNNCANITGRKVDIMYFIEGIIMRKIQISRVLLIIVLVVITSITTSFALAYTVKSGDSLFKIGKTNGVTVNTLIKDNNLKSTTIYPGQVLNVPVKTQPVNPTATLAEILKAKGITSPSPKLNLLVDKSDHLLTVYWGTTFLKSYHVDIGSGGQSDKEVQGDRKTPEGTFYITERSILSPADEYLGTRWMEFSYPNIEDADRGLRQGIINKATHDDIVYAINNKLTPPQDTALGGGVGVHGGTVPSFEADWTWGCIGLKNGDVQDFYSFTKVGTVLVIQK